jgi:hypothetical protein
LRVTTRPARQSGSWTSATVLAQWRLLLAPARFSALLDNPRRFLIVATTG